MEKNYDLKLIYSYIKKVYEKEKVPYQYLNKITSCNKWNCVFTESNYVGVAFNFTGEHAVYSNDFDYEEFLQLKKYVGKNLFELVEYLINFSSIQMRSVCLATFNALSQLINTVEYFNKSNIELLETKDFNFIKPDDVVSLVGYGGVVDKIQGRCKEFHILDMRPKHILNSLSIGENIEYGPLGINFHSSNDNEKILSKSDVVIMSGCTLVNGTFKEIISYSKKAKVIGMFGPSAQLAPEFLFENGVNYILTNKVTNANGLYDSIMNPFTSNSFHSNMESYAIKPLLCKYQNF